MALAPIPITLTDLEIFRVRKLECLGYRGGVVCVILRLAVSIEHRLVTDRQTNRQTDTMTTAYTALAWLRAVKSVGFRRSYGQQYSDTID